MQEQVGGVEVEVDGIFVADLVFVSLIARGDELRHWRHHVLPGIAAPDEGPPEVEAGGRQDPGDGLFGLKGCQIRVRQFVVVVHIRPQPAERCYQGASLRNELPLPVQGGCGARLLLRLHHAGVQSGEIAVLPV